MTDFDGDFDFDFFVIGAGSGGVRSARTAAALGARVGIAEERYYGGTCVNVGCVPKKLFSYAAHYRDDFEDARGFGWTPGSAGFDWATLVKNKDQEISRLNDVYKTILNKHEVRIYPDRAVLTGPHSLKVGEQTLTAAHILVAVGGWPWVPEFPGSEYTITSNDLFHLPSLPKRMAIMGGGYIALEFASIFSRLGVETSLIYRRDRLLRNFDRDISHFITQELGRETRLYLSDEVQEITKNDNELNLKLTSGNELQVDAVLAATGRRPLTADLGLDSVAVETSATGGIQVDEYFQTNEPSIYAVGDVIERMELTPVALAEGEIVARSLFSKEKKEMDYHNIATAVFCHPNIATVGFSEQEALAKHQEVDVYLSTFKQLKHTLSGREEQSLMKLVVDSATDRVLGVHVVAPDAGELVQGFAVALNCGATKADFDRTVGIHPTMAEELVTMRNKRQAKPA